MTDELLADPRHYRKVQALHTLLLAALLGVAWQLHTIVTASSPRTLLGLGANGWFVVAIGVPIIHQSFVWYAWRSELCYSRLSRWWGNRAFSVYHVIFQFLFWSRPLTLAALAYVDRGSLPFSAETRVVLSLLLAAPALYTAYSVLRYFGFRRAAGADHFDPRFRQLPLVRDGIFRYVTNSMYVFAFLFFWIIALVAASSQALIVAGFSHAYIWVHYFCTERPDMRVIYGK